MCFSDSTRRCTSRCLKFFSFLLFLVSIGLIVASFTLFKPVKDKVQSGKFHSQYEIEGNVLAQKLCKIGGIGGIIMSVLAYLVAKKKVPYLALPFMLGAFAMGGIFSAVFITTISQETALYYKKETCSAMANTGKKVSRTGYDVARNMNIHFIDMHMCSRTCPCAKSKMYLWKNMFTEQDLKERLRTWSGNAEKIYTPMFFNVDDFKDDDKAKKGYDTFEECYHDKVREHPEVYGITPESKEAYEDFTERNSFNLLRHYEKEYQCSGVCDVPLFYLTKSVAEGPPSEDCVEAVIKSITDDYLVAAISCVGAFAFFAAGISAFPNCCQSKKQKEKKKAQQEYKNRMQHYELKDEVEVTNYSTR